MKPTAQRSENKVIKTKTNCRKLNCNLTGVRFIHLPNEKQAIGVNTVNHDKNILKLLTIGTSENILKKQTTAVSAKMCGDISDRIQMEHFNILTWSL